MFLQRTQSQITERDRIGWQDIDSGRVALRGIIALLGFAVMLGGARPAMTAPPTGMIEGIAKDAQGRPLSGVQLTLRAATDRIIKWATSRPDGRYSFGDIAGGDYSISGTKEGFTIAMAAVAVRAGAPFCSPLRFKRE
jgi:hypothetical protein